MIVKLRVRDSKGNTERFSDIKINPYIIENNEVIKSEKSYSIRKTTGRVINDSLFKLYTGGNIIKLGEDIKEETDLITKNANLIIEKFNEKFKDKYHMEEIKDDLEKGLEDVFKVFNSNKNLYYELKVKLYKEHMESLIKKGVFKPLSASLLYELVKEIDKL